MRVLFVIATGCATTSSVGVQSVATGDTGSVEATANAGIGLGSKDDAITGAFAASLGGGPRGVQGRIGGRDEYIRFGQTYGWQAHFGAAASLGGYQSTDLAFELGGGAHWNLRASRTASEVRIVSVALDAFVGYAFRQIKTDPSVLAIPFANDSPFFGVGLSLRRDRVTGFDWKPPD
jgi:hypothetical protein